MKLEHKGYIANVSLEDGDEYMHGEVVNTRATLHFAGKDASSLRKAFADTIKDYLALCKERGIAPEKPYSGEFRLRVGPLLHRRLAEAAQRRGTSLNAFVEERLSATVEREDVTQPKALKKRKIA